MVSIHPMFDDDVEIKNFLVDEKELRKVQYAKMFYFDIDSITVYKNKKKIVDHIESKCPYHKE